MNTHIQSPEIVVIGYNNANKAAIIEAFLGYALVEAKDILFSRSVARPPFPPLFLEVLPLLSSLLLYQNWLQPNLTCYFAVLGCLGLGLMFSLTAILFVVFSLRLP